MSDEPKAPPTPRPAPTRVPGPGVRRVPERPFVWQRMIAYDAERRELELERETISLQRAAMLGYKIEVISPTQLAAAALLEDEVTREEREAVLDSVEAALAKAGAPEVVELKVDPIPESLEGGFACDHAPECSRRHALPIAVARFKR